MTFNLLLLLESIQVTRADIVGVIFQSQISSEVEPLCSQAQPPASEEPAVAPGAELCWAVPGR